MIIRKATINDAQTLFTFSVALGEETGSVLPDLEKEKIKKGVMQPLKNPEHGFFLVAEENSKVIGSLFVTREWNTWLNGEWWILYDVYTKPEFRRKGVLRNLFEEVENIGKKDPLFKGLRLFVLEGNTNAKNAYKKLGMKNLSRVVYEKKV